MTPSARTRLTKQAVGDAADRSVPYIASAIVAAAALVVLWTRLTVLQQSLWGDEVIDIVRYASHGPGTIWSSGAYIQGDQVLFELLSWATGQVLGLHDEATYRLWSVLPGIAGGALTTWWLWRRFGPWTAAIFAVLAAVNPVYYQLTVESRGYGLGFLAGAGVLIGADGMTRQSRQSAVLFGASGFVGIATIPNFAFYFIGAALVLLLIRRCRRATVIAVAATGVASLLWWAPLISGILNNERHPARGHDLWTAFVVAPVRDLVAPTVTALLPGTSMTFGEVIAAALLAVGVVVLLRVRPVLLALIVVPVVTSYLLVNFVATYAVRFSSFTILPVLALVAVGIGGAGELLPGAVRTALTVSWARATVLTVLVAASIFALGRFVHWSTVYGATPYESARPSAQLVTAQLGTPEPIFSNFPGIAFDYYLDLKPRPRFDRPRTLAPAALAHALCSTRGPFTYIDTTNRPAPDPACLRARHAFEFAFPQHRAGVRIVWLVP